jgi:hypothetical protein
MDGCCGRTRTIVYVNPLEFLFLLSGVQHIIHILLILIHGDGCTDWFEYRTNSDLIDPNIPGRVYCTSGGTTNIPPVVGSQTVSTSKNRAITITLTGSDQNGDSLGFVIISKPSSGILGVIMQTGPISGSNNLHTKARFCRNGNFYIYAYDGKANSNPGTITINVQNKI